MRRSRRCSRSATTTSSAARIQDPTATKLPGDFVYFQGHASPGVYARAFLEGRLSEKHLENFRHELRDHPGLSSYPHPWLMPDFWQFPTVSMGLGPIGVDLSGALHAVSGESRHHSRRPAARSGRSWATAKRDEPESLGALTLASREKLDNLIFVVNCNLQRLDGPVRGNGSIIQELEAAFLGAGWNVIKVVWGSGWDDLLARDSSGLLIKRMHECVDGEYQAFRAMDGAYIRKEFFGKYPELLKLVEHMSDDEIWDLRRGGLDPLKVFNAYQRAMKTQGPADGDSGQDREGLRPGRSRRRPHDRAPAEEAQRRRSAEDSRPLQACRFPTKPSTHVDFYRPAEDSPEMKYLRAAHRGAGRTAADAQGEADRDQGARRSKFSRMRWKVRAAARLRPPRRSSRVLKALLKIPELGKLVVPIIPDEARTFGMESLFREYGIYASQGQRYKPVDSNVLLYYKEAQNGQILEEGITEAGSMASCIAAGTAYANYGVPMIPFYIYYSMFGFQRVGDLIWAFADSRGKGFLMGGTAGPHHAARRGLAASGRPQSAAVQRRSHLRDLRSGLRVRAGGDHSGRHPAHVSGDGRSLLLHLTVYNENYVQPPMPASGSAEVNVRWSKAETHPQQCRLRRPHRTSREDRQAMRANRISFAP